MNQNVGALLRERKRKYFARGIAFAVASGICYGLYTGFLTLGETQGVWGEWFAGSEWGEGNPAPLQLCSPLPLSPPESMI